MNNQSVPHNEKDRKLWHSQDNDDRQFRRHLREILEHEALYSNCYIEINKKGKAKVYT
jgi:hypothetical protein